MKNPYSTPDDKQTAKDCGISVSQLRVDRKRDDKPSKNRIESVRIETVTDTDPDTSYIGHYTNHPSPEAIIRVGEHAGKQVKDLPDDYEHPSRGREYLYFLPAMTAEETGNPESPKQDFERMESLNDGQWCFVGIIAKAVIVSAQGVTQTIRSGGLWGIESDSDKSYLEEIARDELFNLRAELEAFGFGKRAIDYAFKNRS